MNVRSVVDRIVKKYKTRSPYELADLTGIEIIRCELGAIRGYYLCKYRIKQIALNCNLSPKDEAFVLSHEIGHSIMHPNLSTPFLIENTYFSTNKLEIEANKFATELLLPDEIIFEHKDFTIEQLARLTGYSEALIKLRLQ